MNRTEYMESNDKNAHRIYYAQFVTPGIIAAVKAKIGINTIKNSKDPHFNDIPLVKWDSFDSYFEYNVTGVSEKMKECGDYLTLSGIVCIVKEAARQIKENN